MSGSADAESADESSGGGTRRTSGKGRSQSKGGGRDSEDVEDLEAEDADAEAVQAQLDDVEEDVEEDLDELMDELNDVQAGGPTAATSSTETVASQVDDTAAAADHDDAPSWDDEPSPSEFARRVFEDEVVQDKHLDGEGDIAVTPPEEAGHDDRYGGYDEYSKDQIGKWEQVNRLDDEGAGFTAMSKDRGTPGPDAEFDGPQVYRTNYDSGQLQDRDDLKTNQMGMYAFKEALGVETPQMTYDADDDAVVAESYRPDGEYSARAAREVRPDAANRVDRDEFVDSVAVHLLGGDTDCTKANIDIGEDGTVHTYDYDRASGEFPSINSFKTMKMAAGDPAKAAESIDEARDADNQLDVSREEIANRAAEIAYEIETSGRTEEVVSAVEGQMDAMAANSNTDPGDCNNHEIIRTNIEEAADVARDRFGWE